MPKYVVWARLGQSWLRIASDRLGRKKF